MAETIRDVVIRLALKQVGDAKLTVDTSQAVKAQQEYGQVATGTQQDIVASIAKAAEAAAEATKQRIAEEQAIAAAAKAAAAEQRKIANDARRLAKEQEQAAKALAAEQAKQARLAEEATKAQEAASRKVVEQNLKAGDAFKTAGDGAFTLLRGITLLGVAGEKDMQKVVQAVAQVQGAFDIFKGGFDLYKGLIEGSRALQEAQKAAAVANGALAVSNAAVGTSAGGAAAGLTAMQVAMGPVGAVALAIGAGLAALVLVMREMAAEESRLAAIEEATIARRTRMKEAQEKLAVSYQNARTRAGLLAGGEAQEFRQRESTRIQADIDRAASGRAEAQRKLVEQQDLLLRRQVAQQGFSSGFQARDIARDEEAIAEQKKIVAAFAEQEKQGLEAKLQLTLEIGEAAKREVEKQKESTRELERQRDELNRLAQAKANELIGLQGEKESRELRFGALSGREQAEAKRLSEKEAAGTLTEAEARRQEELLGRTAGTRRTLLGAARDRGSEDVVSRLGVGEGTFASELERIRSERDAALDDARAKVATIESSSATAAEKLDEIGKGVVRAFDFFTKRIDEVSAAIRQVEAANQGRGDD